MAGDTIEFSQTTTQSHSGHFLDNETGDIHSEVINGISYEFKEWHQNKTVLWTNNGYVFSIECIGDISLNEIKQMITCLE